MDKIYALAFILFVQPVFGFLVWFSMHQLFVWIGLEGTVRFVVVLMCTAFLYGIFCFFFARGFLSSSEAKRLGF